MKFLKHTFFLISLLFVFNVFAQQEPQYTQYMFNQLVLNPAYAGSKEVLSASLFHRDQWRGFDGHPQTNSLSLHNTTKKNKVGWGVNFTNDQIGPKTSNTLLCSYSYKIRFLNGKLSFGLRAGIAAYTFNWLDVTHKDAADPTYQQRTNSETTIAPTADFGMYYYTNSFYVGLSSVSLFKSQISKQDNDSLASNLARHSFLTLGKAWSRSDNFVFNPSIMIKKAKGAPFTVDINISTLLKQRLWLGLSFRSNHSACVYSQLKVSDKFKVGLSFDSNRFIQYGIRTKTIEVMIGYDLNIFKSKIISPRYL